MLPEFIEQSAEFLREAGAARAPRKSFSSPFVPQQQRAQHHHAAFVAQLFGRRDVQFFKNKSRQPLE